MSTKKLSLFLLLEVPGKAASHLTVKIVRWSIVFRWVVTSYRSLSNAHKLTYRLNIFGAFGVGPGFWAEYADLIITIGRPIRFSEFGGGLSDAQCSDGAMGSPVSAEVSRGTGCW